MNIWLLLGTSWSRQHVKPDFVVISSQIPILNYLKKPSWKVIEKTRYFVCHSPSCHHLYIEKDDISWVVGEGGAAGRCLLQSVTPPPTNLP